MQFLCQGQINEMITEKKIIVVQRGPIINKSVFFVIKNF